MKEMYELGYLRELVEKMLPFQIAQAIPLSAGQREKVRKICAEVVQGAKDWAENMEKECKKS